MAKGKKEDLELVDMKRRLLVALRSGDMEAASDALLEVWMHHGVLYGDTQMLDRFAVASGLIGGLKDRKRIAGIMANRMSTMIEKEAEKDSEPDYESRLTQ
tara:strand:+ start:368 stop:670 length:303 start_codon:yes stop_codon:yes gene_type:complete